MGDPFLSHWFHGLESALHTMDTPALDTLMTHCGQACSASFSEQVYREQYAASADLDDFLSKLSHAFADMEARRVDADTLEINYTYCTCDLVRNGYITSPKLCLCSLKSLQHNWESVLGKGSVTCRMEQSILDGSDHCRFLVKLRQNTEDIHP